MFLKICSFLIFYLLASTLAHSIAARSESTWAIKTDNAKKVEENLKKVTENIETGLRKIAEELLSKPDAASTDQTSSNRQIDGTKVLEHSGKTLAGAQQKLQQHSGATLDSTQENLLSPVSDIVQQELLTSPGTSDQNGSTRLVRGLFDSPGNILEKSTKVVRRSGKTQAGARHKPKKHSKSTLDFGTPDQNGDTRLAKGLFDTPLEFLQLAESFINFGREFVLRLYWLYYDNYDWINSLVRTVVYNIDHLHSFSLGGIRVLTQLLGYGNSLLGGWQPENSGTSATYDLSQWQQYYQQYYGNSYSQEQPQYDYSQYYQNPQYDYSQGYY